MKKQVSLTLTAALLLGACSTTRKFRNIRRRTTAVGFLADIAPREQSADINVDFETGLTGTWNSEDKLGVRQ
ncbi:MAG: hypothetical protein ACLT1W_13695 [Alistipes onderdonkii]